MKTSTYSIRLPILILGLTFSFNAFSQTCGTTISTFPYNESFESGLGSWTQDGGDDFDWTRESGGTPSGSTGPNSAYNGSYFMFTEASGNYNNTGNLESPCLDLTGIPNPQFSFYYHRYGADMGNLYIDVSLNSGNTYTNLQTLSGQNHNNSSATWSASIIDLTAYSGQTIKLRFRGETGSFYRSDMAIDNIRIENTTIQPEIDIYGGVTEITNGDSTPSLVDRTDFGDVDVSLGSTTNIFTIENTGNDFLNLNGSPLVDITGTHKDDFSVSVSPSNSIAGGNSTTFSIVFNPSALGTRTATISIENNDSNEDPYSFSIVGNGIDFCATTVASFPYNENFETDYGQLTQDATDDMDWTRNSGGTPSTWTGPANAASGSFYIFTESSGNYNKTANLDTPCFDLTGIAYPEFSFSYHMYGSAIGTLNILISENGGAYTNIWNRSGAIGNYWNNEIIDLSAYTNKIVKIKIQGITANSYRGDMAIDDISLINNIPAPEIKILGDGIEIVDGDTTPSGIDDTNYGIINLGSPLEQTFTIDNTDGTDELVVSSISLSNTTDFTITGTPYNSPVPAGGITTFSITYNALTTGTQTSTVTIFNGDDDEFEYDFLIEGATVQYFYDSDGDGILDNVDVDDDNDGILDTVEELACENSGGNSVNYKFLNETFGVGTGRTTIDSNNYSATTTYNYEDASTYPATGWILDDGEYVVTSKVTRYPGDPGNIDNIHGDLAWYQGDDHTPGDTEGRMAVFNASFDPGVFYETEISGILSGLPITYSFWALNIMTPSNFSGSILPNITVQFLDLNENEITSFNTGEFGICEGSTTDNSCAQSEWHQFTTSVNLGNTNAFIVRFINNAPGGGGNDLAIDDIVIAQTLCDTDMDGIADVFDLDADNDGIPDVVEAGLGDYSEGSATLTNTAGWVDNNANGMNDANEGHIILDTDGDETPNFIDLDSDNDTIFDVDESGAGNTADTAYQNGDGDITGDGVGDGPDTDAVRIKDEDYDGNVEYFADGILDIYDFYNGGTFSTAFGNVNQGLGSTFFVLDTDNDGTPDYMDTTSDGSTFDISHTLYADLDLNSNGLIGGINYSDDADMDGILDLFDTDDINFGSPRDLDRKLHLFFDGRNDYSEESTVINGWSEASIMAWIKTPSTPTSEQVILGQDEFYLTINSSMIITAHGGDDEVSISKPLETNRWYHIAATYSDSNSALTVFINGQQINDTSVSGAFSADASSFTIGRKPDTNSNFYHGYIDEVRVFEKALSNNELQKMVYQEIEENSTYTRGTVIPKDLTDFIDESTSTPLDWSSLTRYYRMDVYKDDIIDDLSTSTTDTGTGMKIHNTKLIDVQSAPLPFITQSSGNLNEVLDIPLDGVNGNDAITYDWSIVKVEHNNVTYNSNQKHLGLFIDELDASTAPIEFHVNNDSELNVSWYLELNGFIDLEGESQLVQGSESELAVGTNGKIERDQQGTADTFTYNYWSSPVGTTTTASPNNFSYSLNSVLKDGTTTSGPVPITFLASGHNGSAGPPISIADRWIWKFANKLDDDYASWQHVRSSGTLLAGEGFTMKGPGSGPISADQNYVFDGKPNNGDINLDIDAGNDYLVGNPYASAIDAQKFILDNGPVIDGVNGPADPSISGTLYFWEHWGGGSHVLKEYEGGYATYNLSGGVVAVAKGAPDDDVAQIGVGVKTPGRYIPVSQGFFVVAEGAGGTINFNNSQRIFHRESSGNSIFMDSNSGNDEGFVAKDSKPKSVSEANNNEDPRLKIKIGLNSVSQYHRQLLVTADENASLDIDWGYDGKVYDLQKEDLFWRVEDDNFVIQGVDKISLNTKLPLGIKTSKDGKNNISIEDLLNAPNDLDIFIHDKSLNTYHDLRTESLDVYLPAGEYLERFELVFTDNEALSTIENEYNKIDIHFSNTASSIILINPELIQIKSVELINIIGQNIYSTSRIITQAHAELKVNNLSAGAYIIKLNTQFGIISKKVIVR